MTPRHLLMCPPRYFTVSYSINPWMVPERPSCAETALGQWERLRALYLRLGHTVDLVQPDPRLPDMVFAANGATVIGGRVFGARFRHPQRVAEGPLYSAWLRDHGFPEVYEPEFINEGEGDYLLAGRRILAGTGFRTDPRSHAEARDFFGLPVVSLTLVDPRFYHLDTALAVLGGNEVMYHPDAFSRESRGLLRELYPDAVLVSRDDAEVFGLNAFCDGRHVILPTAAVELAARLADRGFEPIGLDLPELLKAGGGVKCCTLELRL